MGTGTPATRFSNTKTNIYVVGPICSGGKKIRGSCRTRNIIWNSFRNLCSITQQCSLFLQSELFNEPTYAKHINVIYIQLGVTEICTLTCLRVYIYMLPFLDNDMLLLDAENICFFFLSCLFAVNFWWTFVAGQRQTSTLRSCENTSCTEAAVFVWNPNS